MSRPPGPRLPAAPLLRQVALRGGPRAVGVRQSSAEEQALLRAQRSGTVTVKMGDRLAVKLLGLTAYELWGDHVAV